MVAPYIPDRGDLVWVAFDPTSGHEQAGRRPALILSPRQFNERTSLAVACPVTSQIKGLPFEVVLNQTKTIGAVLPIHVRSIDWQARQVEFIEQVPTSITEEVAQSVGVMIDLPI